MVFPLLKTFGGDKGGKLQNRIDNLGQGAQLAISAATSVGSTAIQIATDKSLRSAGEAQSDIVDGILLVGEAVTSGGGSIIQHNLGRVPIGAFVVSSDTVGEALRIEKFTASTFEAEASVDVTVSFWVF